MKHTKIGLAAADLVLPQRYLYASSSLQMWRRESFAVYGVLGTIASFILDDH